MTPTAELARDRGDVELVDGGAERDLACRAPLAGRLAYQGRELRSLDGAEVVDDALRVRLRRADFSEIGAQEVGDDDAAAVEDLGPVESARKELQLRELDRLVDALEDLVHVGAGFDEIGGEP